MAWNFTPFTMPGLNFNDKGGAGFQGSTTPYVDNAAALATKHGYQDPRTQGMQTRDVMRYQNGLGMEYMGQGFNGLGQSIGDMGEQLTDNMTEMSQYGGLFGNTGGVYSPQSRNGYGMGLGGNNPWKIGSF